MSTYETTLDEFGVPVAENPWPRRLYLPFMIALGFVVFELTADPVLGLVVACLKFGTSDAITAFWIARHDPIPGRGRACMWFLIARGLGKVSASALVLGLSAIVSIFISAVVNLNNAQHIFGLLKHMTAGLISCLITLFSMIPTTFLGVRASRRSGFKIWIDGRTNFARKRRVWPPLDLRSPRPIRRNDVQFLILAACFASLFSLMIAGSVSLVEFHVREGPMLNLVFIASHLLGTLILVWSIMHLTKLAAAESPSDCWPELLERGGER